MSGETEGNTTKRKRYKEKNVVLEYVLKAFLFVAVAMAVLIFGIAAALEPATEYVHKIEKAYCMQAKDIVIDKNASLIDYNNKDKSLYGAPIAYISCENKGINTEVYYGLNRASMRNGVGLLTKSSLFGDEGSVIGGLDQTYFSALKTVEAGDIVKITTASSVIMYKVKDTVIADAEKPDIDKKNKLVLFSVYSGFSDNSGKCFYAVCDKVSEEVMSNE